MTGNVEKERERPNPTTRPLHNFTLPSHLKWGHQKHLRCSMRLSESPADQRRWYPIAPSAAENQGSKEQLISPICAPVSDDEIEAVRRKLVTDLQAAAESMKQTIREHTGERERVDVINIGDKKPSEEDSNPAAWRWTLRNRRAGDGTGKVNLMQPQKNNKFSITLSREEIEADFMAITDAKPPRKPKKRPRALQKEIDVKALKRYFKFSPFLT